MANSQISIDFKKKNQLLNKFSKISGPCRLQKNGQIFGQTLEGGHPTYLPWPRGRSPEGPAEVDGSCLWGWEISFALNEEVARLRVCLCVCLPYRPPLGEGRCVRVCPSNPCAVCEIGKSDLRLLCRGASIYTPVCAHRGGGGGGGKTCPPALPPPLPSLLLSHLHTSRLPSISFPNPLPFPPPSSPPPPRPPPPRFFGGPLFDRVDICDEQRGLAWSTYWRAGRFRYFIIFSLIKNDFLHFLSS